MQIYHKLLLKLFFSVLLGQARVYVKTWGCAHNSSDSEYMAGQLAAQVGRLL